MNLNTLEKFARLEAEVARCTGALRAAEDAVDAARVQHCVDNPLSEEVIAMMSAHVLTGGALCCEKGQAWLSKHVDGIWVEILNGWAHEALACSEDRPERLAEYARKVLDRLHDLGFAEKWIKAMRRDQ